ncbi:hypothetical protein [Streptomyces tanashiensis]|uniref:hypothetical protein n=1 Tax=Streptomyces tanashiensis TaxID=67367 RepID=UPI00167CF56C|nr:hypothetical protein [Streptomyces tanashiensis]GGY21747.1 hypothetical protein GCM10010299_29770 [Streptomyces tanashiensis]
MKAHSELRLLPWSGPDGKPCYLSTDDDSSHLSRLADTTEAAQLDAGQELLEHAMEVIADAESGPAELRLLAVDLTEALRDTLRVAVSRGHRLPAPDSAAREEEDASPRVPTTAFG